MKKELKKKMKYVDESCEEGERVYWNTMIGERFEGILIEWDNCTAIIKLDDGTIKAVSC